MSRNTRIYNKFTGYTAQDCSCIYCLYYQDKKGSCSLSQCCCAEELMEAYERERLALENEVIKKRRNNGWS